MGSQITNVALWVRILVSVLQPKWYLLVLAGFVDVDLQNTEVGELLLSCSPAYPPRMCNATLMS